MTKDQIKAWLERTGRDRTWLAEACGASKNTVNNWLSTNINVPAKALRIIESLIKADREAARAKEPVPPMTVVLEVSPADFDAMNRQATEEGLIIREWAVEVLNRAARRDRDQAEQRRSLLRVAEETTPVSEAVEHPYWLDLRGGVAAGAPITADVVAEPVACLKEWPDDHYALRVFGESMKPKVRDGAMIVVQEWPADRTPKKGTIVVYADGHGATLKEFGYRKAKAGEEGDSMGNVPVLRSLNPQFPEVQTMEGGRIEAVLVEVL